MNAEEDVRRHEVRYMIVEKRLRELIKPFTQWGCQCEKCRFAQEILIILNWEPTAGVTNAVKGLSLQDARLILIEAILRGEIDREFIPKEFQNQIFELVDLLKAGASTPWLNNIRVGADTHSAIVESELSRTAGGSEEEGAPNAS